MKIEITNENKHLQQYSIHLRNTFQKFINKTNETKWKAEEIKTYSQDLFKQPQNKIIINNIVESE